MDPKPSDLDDCLVSAGDRAELARAAEVVIGLGQPPHPGCHLCRDSACPTHLGERVAAEQLFLVERIITRYLVGWLLEKRDSAELQQDLEQERERRVAAETVLAEIKAQLAQAWDEGLEMGENRGADQVLSASRKRRPPNPYRASRAGKS